MTKTQEMTSQEVGTTNEIWILTATILASSMAFIDGSALNVALPVLQSSLHATGADLLWIVNAYMLMLAALILVGGALGDRLGRKKVYMMGIALFCLASLASGLSPSVQWLIPARIVQGIGGALMIPGSLAIISATLPPNRRGKAIGTWSAVTTLVTVAGPVLGGFLADAGLWRAVFLINLPIGVAAMIVLFLRVPENRDETIKGHIDVYGAVLATIGLGGLTYGFLTAPELGFANPLIWGTLLVGVLALLAFVVLEQRLQHPMLPLALFRSRTFSGTNLLTFFLYGALSVGSFFLALNLTQVQGYSKTQAGFSFLPFSILLILMSRWSGGLADRIGPRLPLIVGPSIVGLGYLWLAFTGLTPGPGTYWTTFMPGTILFGIGMGFTVAPLSTSVMGSVPNHFSGTASGVNNAVSRTAGVLAVAIIGGLGLIMFASLLRTQTAPMGLSPQAQVELDIQSRNLAGAQPPQGLSVQQRDAMQQDIKLSFVSTFRMVVLICAGMAWLSALMAFFLVESDYRKKAENLITPTV